MFDKIFLLLRPALLWISLALCATPVCAEPQVEATDSDLWQRSRDAADVWWQRSWDSAEDLWQETLRQSSDLLEDADGLWTKQQADSFTRIWTDLLPTLDQTLTLTEQHEDLPQQRWLGADQVSNQAEIDDLLDEAVTILSISDLQDVRGRIKTLRQATELAQQDIADLRRQRVVAPDEALWTKTADEYDAAVAARIADIERYRRELADVEAEFARGLRDIGLNLTNKQVSLLLSTVVGDNVVDLAIVFDNVKVITVQLEQLVNDSGEDLNSARRYYGMYVILLKALDRMHLQTEKALTERYIPKLDAISKRAKALTVETRRLRQQSPEKRELLDANLRAQRLTVDATATYRGYLLDQSKQVAEARRVLDKDIDAAWNTYETVRVSGEFVTLVNSSRKLLDGLLNRQVPTLRPFRNTQMRQELEKLTEQLR